MRSILPLQLRDSQSYSILRSPHQQDQCQTGLLHKIDSLDLLKTKMKTKMTKKRQEMHEEEKEEEEVITENLLERHTNDVSLPDPP
ncbi:hypothetical protein llap_13062 [Limosa lapponica baueri]|uniref:Uncharacterized protein n=1 Tax=Limosa lapponica baueri TaxID=1758121 RepID=A0A2I0TS47_LIMLA|nr:hypothetical protein llap_13062 [Limosa lapponica baueri]